MPSVSFLGGFSPILQPLTFRATDFTASGGASWTVAAGNVQTYSFSVMGKLAFLVLFISGSSVSVAAPTDLIISNLPFTTASVTQGLLLHNQTGTSESGFWYRSAASQISLRRFNVAWANNALAFDLAINAVFALV